MYKVFVNDCLIILTDNSNILTDLPIYNFDSSIIQEKVKSYLKSNEVGTCFICNDLDKSWNEFKELFKIQKAAGGKVLNNENEVLFIYRFNKWDLPKGKLEKNESIEACAVREVEEECGVKNLQIKKKLDTTYHIFQRKNKTILKVTYWFEMFSNFKGALIPQEEEGIENVVYKNEKETKKALENTYENIKLLF